MILNIGTIQFNANIKKGGNPSWGTDLGQGSGYYFTFDDKEEILTSMVYCAVKDIDKVDIPIGKGGSRSGDFEKVIASHYKKVFVNGLRVNGGEFILLMIKQIKGQHHVGRRTLKYSPNITYNSQPINQDCFDKIIATLQYKKDTAWFIDEINVRNQDELHFTAYKIDDTPVVYNTSDDRKDEMLKYRNANNPNSQLRVGLRPEQTILFGAPGTGKSFTLETRFGTNNSNTFRTTFHPDCDYSTFVGCYKPIQSAEDKEKITYSYVAQSFTRAYIKAWKLWVNANEEKLSINLIIEEINRGNCAQIFGDIFQLLDRDILGFSRYAIITDEDLRTYLMESFYDIYEDDMFKKERFKKVATGEEMILPPNFNILATMNTSDQSLFPIDSAFKRRWEWEYIPIEYDPKDDKNKSMAYMIDIDGTQYDWGDFIEQVNDAVYKLTNSEDKQLGYFFVSPDNDKSITKKRFVSKVLFYLWSDIYKDYAGQKKTKFKKEIKEGEYEYYSFNSFFVRGEINTELVKEFIEQFVKPDSKKSSSNPYIITETKTSTSIICKSNARLASEVIELYVKVNAPITVAGLISNWTPVMQGVPGNTSFLKNQIDYSLKNYTSAKWTKVNCSDGPVYVNRENWYATGDQKNMDIFIQLVNNNKTALGIEIAEQK